MIRARMSRWIRNLAILWACALPLAQATADEVADFYRGRNVSLVIGYPPGGGFDASARLLMRHIGKHIPGNPTLIPKNMPGAGSIVATNYLFNIAPKDGSEFGMIGGSVPFGPLWSREGVKFEATKFNWIGSMDRWVGIVLLRQDAPAMTVEDAKNTAVTVGATGSGDVTSIYPRVINELIGTKFKVVGGYQGTSDLNLAIERGEVQGRLGWCWDCVKAEKPDWVSDRKIRVMMQLGFDKDPELPDAPMLIELAMSEEDRQIVRLVFGSQEMARPLLAPPGVPQARIAALRTAFERTMKDPEFLAEAKRLKLPVRITTWPEIKKLISEVYATPEPVLSRAAKIVNEK